MRVFSPHLQSVLAQTQREAFLIYPLKSRAAKLTPEEEKVECTHPESAVTPTYGSKRQTLWQRLKGLALSSSYARLTEGATDCRSNKVDTC